MEQRLIYGFVTGCEKTLDTIEKPCSCSPHDIKCAHFEKLLNFAARVKQGNYFDIRDVNCV